MTRRDALSPDVLTPDATTNLSLWLDRYLLEFDQAMVHQHHFVALETVRVPAGYARAFERRKAALREMTGDHEGGVTRMYSIVVKGRAVVGIGAASVRETNLSLLRPWGVPFVPGSSLKGLASHHAHGAGGAWRRPSEPGEEAGEAQRAVFGDVTSAGAVVFHDAWWVPQGDKAPVGEDTMTVHHMTYYQGQKDAAPLDWDEPGPVGFLTMWGEYLFAMTGPPEALDVVAELLGEALEHRGVGAKTAAGYGRAALTLHTSPLVKKLDAFQRPAAQPNTIAGLAQEFARVVAEVGEFDDEREAAQGAARRLFSANPRVWRDWLGKGKPDDVAALTPYFAPLLDAPKAPPPATASAPSAASPASPPERAASTTEARVVRVQLIRDKKAPKRFELRIEGTKKDVKSQTVEVAPDLVAALDAAAAEGLVLAVTFVDGKPTRLTRPDGEG